MVDKLVISGADQRVACVAPEARAIDHGLWVLDANADGKRLLLHCDATSHHRVERIPGAIAHCENDMLRRDLLPVGEDQAREAALAACRADVEIDHLRFEPLLPAQFQDRLADVLDHRYQTERAYMRLADVEDFVRCARCHEFGEHFAPDVSGIFDAAVELAVGEGTGAAFAELRIAVRIEDPLAPQAPSVFGAFPHHLAALDYDWTKTHLRKGQRRKQAARSATDNDGPRNAPARRFGDELIIRVRCRPHMLGINPAQRSLLIPDLDVDRIDELDCGALARVIAAPLDGPAQDVGLGNGEDAAQRRHKVSFVVIERQPQLRNSEHNGFLLPRFTPRLYDCNRLAAIAAKCPVPADLSGLP